MNTVETAGRQAYLANKGERDCPFVDCTAKLRSAADYWDCDAGKRQLWLRGFRYAAVAKELFRKR